MSYFHLFLFFSIALVGLWSCGSSEEQLPYLGNHLERDGAVIYHQIRDFEFINQDSQRITHQDLAGKAYVADFFFRSCPTICPKVMKNMLRISERYQEDDRLLLVSYTVDPKRDTVEALAEYAYNLGVTSDQWHFLTGERDSIYAIAEDYMSIAMEDADAPGGFNHSGYLLLVDGSGHLRAYADGTNAKKVDIFMEEIDQLLRQEF